MNSTLPFLWTLNTSTLRPFSLSVKDQIRVAAQAGFSGIELWVRDLVAYVGHGGNIADIKAVAEDSGIQVVNGIAFFKWTDDNPKIRAAALEEARFEMDLLLQVGCDAVAAPPTGSINGLDISSIGSNFAELLILGRSLGVEPILEFWGHSKVLHTIAQAADVLAEAEACSSLTGTTMLLDLFHMYKGGSSLEDMEKLSEPGTKHSRIGMVHINDYLLDLPRDQITDADRVMPGDGQGPVVPFMKTLIHVGYSGPMSVELFRSSYGNLNAEETACEALGKTIQMYEIARQEEY